MTSKWRAAAFLLSFFLAACSGGGGGGGNSVTYDNARLSGTFTYIWHDGSDVLIGTCSLDGAGGGTFTEEHPAGPGGSLTYTVTTDNTIAMNNTTIGTLRAGGDFFVATDTTTGGEGMMLAMRQSAVTDAATTFLAGSFANDGGRSVELDRIMTATPLPGQLAWETLKPISGSSGTESYTLDPATGRVSSPASPFQFGAMSAGRDLFMLGDAERIATSDVFAMVGLQLPGSGMSNASLNGTYIIHQLMDEGGAVLVSRGRVSFNSSGSGTYQSLTAAEPAVTFTYAVNTDGTYMIDLGGGAQFEGVVLADGSVLTLIDYDNSDNEVFIGVGVKE